MSVPSRLGKYRLVRRLAVGGMAEVYLAVAEGLSGFEKTVVLKRLHPQHTRDPELLAMFLDEARLMARLKHPHVAEVYDIGEDGGEYYFALEHVEGEDLREVLRFLAGAPLPLAHALTIVRAVAAGLHHAHEQTDAQGRSLGIIHRDVSPSNVLVGWDGAIKLIDFGVAKWAAQRSETRHGTLKGKVAYMSPEQCRGEPLDRRSDVFALGILLYELTTGVRPFDGAGELETLAAIAACTPRAATEVRPDYPPSLASIVAKALAREPSARHATAEAIADDLERFARTEGVVLDAAALAAYLRALFGDRADVRPSTEREAKAPEVSTNWPAASPAPGGLLLERTLTQAPSPALVAPGPTEQTPAPPRGRAAVVVGAAVMAAAALVWALARSTPTSSVPPVKVAATAAVPVAPPPAPEPAAPAPVAPPPRVAPAPPRPAPRAVASARSAAGPVAPTPQASAPAPTPALTPPSNPERPKVWDPDSPLPP